MIRACFGFSTLRGWFMTKLAYFFNQWENNTKTIRELLASNFPRLAPVLWIWLKFVIGSSCCLSLLWFVRVISLVFGLVGWHWIENLLNSTFLGCCWWFCTRGGSKNSRGCGFLWGIRGRVSQENLITPFIKFSTFHPKIRSYVQWNF